MGHVTVTSTDAYVQVSVAHRKLRNTVDILRRFFAFGPGFACSERRSGGGSPIAAEPAVFLHGGWRCGSTYIWSRFRDCAGTLCFYEPFHEILARCTARKVR